MHRAQVLIEPWQYEFLKSRAERQGRSISAVLREILSKELEAKGASKRKGGLEAMEGIVADPKMSGMDHDRILYGKGKQH